jgi:hypothetical protein
MNRPQRTNPLDADIKSSAFPPSNNRFAKFVANVIRQEFPDQASTLEVELAELETCSDLLTLRIIQEQLDLDFQVAIAHALSISFEQLDKAATIVMLNELDLNMNAQEVTDMHRSFWVRPEDFGTLGDVLIAIARVTSRPK